MLPKDTVDDWVEASAISSAKSRVRVSHQLTPCGVASMSQRRRASYPEAL